MWATFGCGSCQSLENGAGEVPNTRVHIHTFEQFRVERNFGFQVSLEVDPGSAPYVRSIRWAKKGWTTPSGITGMILFAYLYGKRLVWKIA